MKIDYRLAQGLLISGLVGLVGGAIGAPFGWSTACFVTGLIFGWIYRGGEREQ